ncbi:uncharacterized protein LOC110710117 [Chenopodium quinoa]|uniref:uncharacterized protein LOC110710117 n=1 Tax=Chenopodium quinoa TaxID=63459 RepID=UPI000B776D61|nr:uncharacterized protein LOC110710117 [Chenopodium quinoa]
MAKKKKKAISTPQIVQQKAAHEVVGSVLKNLGISNTPFVPSPTQEGDELLTPAPTVVQSAGGAISGIPVDVEATSVAKASAKSKQSNGTVPRVSGVTVPLDAGGSGLGGATGHVVFPSSTSLEHIAHDINEDRAAPLSALELSSRDSSENRAASPILEQKGTRASSFAEKLAAKGATLSFIAPKVQDGKLIAELQAAELEEGNRKWANALVFYVVGFYPTIDVVLRFFAQQWNDMQKPDVYWHDDGYFIINMCSSDDRDTILCSGPHMFFGKPAIVKPWCPDFDFHAEILRTIPLWVKFPNLPLNCWGSHTLSRLGSLLGVPICADECTTRQLRVSFARVLIEIDVTKPLPSSVWVESPLKELLEIRMVYEWAPSFCSKCNKIGHDCSVKPPFPKQASKQPAPIPPKQKQVWAPKPTHDPAPSVAVDVGVSVHCQSIITPQVHTTKNSDEGWRIVGRKTKSQQTRVHPARRLLHSHSVDVVGLLETKIKLKNVLTYQKKFGSSWLWLCNYDHSPKGRIWLGWNVDRVTVNVLKIHEQFIQCTVSSKDLSTQIFLTVVYGLHSIHDRLSLWEGLRSISIQHSPWLCVGDYNSILHTSDRLHGVDVTDYETRDFQNLVDDLDLTELKRKGSFYSWSNKAHTGLRTLSRLDRAFGNQAWLASHGHVETVYLPPSLSDHSPVFLDTFSGPVGKGRPFRFLNYIADHPDFLDTVSQAWGSGNSVWQKLNSVKSSIKSLTSKQFGNIEEKIDQANDELSRIQTLMAQNPDDLDLYAKESDAIKVVKHWNDIQESIFKQKSRINWVKLGDGNSHYFFSVMKTRQARNIIDSIFYSNQVLLKDPNAISHEIISFYKSLLGTQAPWLPVVDLITMRRGKQLSSAAQSYLIRPISHAEIDAGLKGIDNTKAPGIDGFNSYFFKRAWHIVKDDIYASVINFFNNGILPRQWNCTTITLVPKVLSASHVKDFRPIACCTVVYKLISKVITARLAAVIGEVIDDAQTGFIPGKHIGDNILLATELIKGYDHKFISPRCMVKVDLKKAYDSVEWGFLITVMQELGFPQRFFDWIWNCLTSVSYCILINGFPAPPPL